MRSVTRISLKSAVRSSGLMRRANLNPGSHASDNRAKGDGRRLNIVSTPCAKGRHSACYSLSCPCQCHPVARVGHA